MIQPYFTEKTLLRAQEGRFTFKVTKSFSKYQIKALIERLFKVEVTGVRTLNHKGAARRTVKGTRYLPSWKTAIVSLKKGQSIDLWSSETPKPKKEKQAKTK